MPALTGSTLIVKGTADTVIERSQTTAMHGTEIYFEGVTINTNSTEYVGFHHSAKETYVNCTFTGTGDFRLYAPVAEVINCTFKNGGYTYVYGCNDATFTGCTFETDGKGILVYNEQTNPNAPAATDRLVNVLVEDCDFAATGMKKTSAGDWIAGVEIDSRFCNFNVEINNCTVNSNFSALVRHKAGAAATVTVDGVDVTANIATHVPIPTV